MISTLCLLAALLGLGIPAALLYIPLTLITSDATPLYRIAQKIARAGLRAARIHVEVDGQETIPSHTACIFMANHVSNLDPPALIPCIPGRTSIFVKRELMRIPVLGYAFKLGELIPVDRAGRVENARQSVAAARHAMSRGMHITTFVEGTRSRDGRMLPFKKGPFYLAMETGAPCVPVSIYGTETMMHKGSVSIRPGTAHIVFHPPLYPANYASRDELMEAMRASIASGLPEWMRG